MKVLLLFFFCLISQAQATITDLGCRYFNERFERCCTYNDANKKISCSAKIKSDNIFYSLGEDYYNYTLAKVTAVEDRKLKEAGITDLGCEKYNWISDICCTLNNKTRKATCVAQPHTSEKLLDGSCNYYGSRKYKIDAVINAEKVAKTQTQYLNFEQPNLKDTVNSLVTHPFFNLNHKH